MQPNDNISVSRRALDVEDYIDILRRHKGWVIGPFLLVSVLTVAGVYLWPDSYRSEARVQIMPQQIPEQMVPSAMTQALVDRIGTMAATITSRSRLTQIINNQKLYISEVAKMPMQDVIELMGDNIDIRPLPTLVGGRGSSQFPAFEVGFTYYDRHAAQRVVEELVAQFMSENVESRGRASYQTEEFAQQSLAEAQQELQDAEDRLTSFRLDNNGNLPDQVNSNAQTLQSLNNQFQVQQNSLSRAQNELLGMQTNLDIYRKELGARIQEGDQVAEVSQTQNSRVVAAERDVEDLQTQLRLALQRYTANHPDVKSVEGRLELAKQKLEEVKAEEATKVLNTPEPAAALPAIQSQRNIRQVEANIQQLETQISLKRTEIETLNRALEETKGQSDIYRRRLLQTPVGEQEYEELQRAARIAEEKYLERKKLLSGAQVANEMQERAQGERLEVIDQASLPTRPSQPNRPVVIGAGVGFGLIIGLVMAGAREMKDTSLKNLKDVRAYTQMAILGSIPLLENDFVVKRRKRIAWLGWTTACLASVVVMAGSVAYYYTVLNAS